MKQTYRAVLKGNRLEWIGKAPDYPEDQPMNVEVTIVTEGYPSEEISRGPQMATILEQLAETGVFSEITDPVSWQREIRKDRVLPGREA